MELPKLLSEIAQTTKFKDKLVDDETIGMVLDAAAHAPSAGNLEPWKFVVVREKEIKLKLAKAALDLEHVAKAPVVIVVCGDVERAASKYAARGEKLYVVQDTAYASLLVLLSCSVVGLGCYLVRSFDEDAVREVLEIPEGVRPFTIIPVGYPEGGKEEADRVVYEDMAFIDKYGRKFEEKFGTIEERLGKILKRRGK